MNKLKLILPFAGLATIPAIVMPITSCNKLDDYDLTLDGTEEMLNFVPYEKQLPTGTKVKVQDAIRDYIGEFNNINKAMGRDIIYNIIKSPTPPTMNAEITLKSIKIDGCYFDTYEWRLSCKLTVKWSNSDTSILKISNLPYVVDPTAHSNNFVYFTPAGAAGGSILQDLSWSIKYRWNSSEEIVYDHNTSLHDWLEFWGTEEDFSGHFYFCFVPYYYWESAIETE